MREMRKAGPLCEALHSGTQGWYGGEDEEKEPEAGSVQKAVTVQHQPGVPEELL